MHLGGILFLIFVTWVIVRFIKLVVKKRQRYIALQQYANNVRKSATTPKRKYKKP